MISNQIDLEAEKFILDHFDLEKWKRDFYRAYEQQDYKEAEEIYLTVGRFYDALPDVHAAYRFHKRMSRLAMIPLALFFLIFITVLFLIFT